MRIRTFKGLVPAPNFAPEVAAVPYDVVNREEAAALAKGKPNSLLHVDRAEIDLDPEIEARNLIRAAVRRELGRRTRVEDPVLIREDIEARQRVEGLDAAQPDPELAEWLLQWLDRRSEERG